MTFFKVVLKSDMFVSMFKITRYNWKAKHLLRLFFVLFALSPCIVKGSLYNVANLDYVKPLSLTKTTIQANSCQYSLDEDSQEVTIIKAEKTKKKTTDNSSLLSTFSPLLSVNLTSKDSFDLLHLYPPKYILYKRLKLSLA